MSNRKAFEEAYRAHKDRLLTLAVALTGDRSAAEDVVHDVFASLAREGWRLHGERNVAGFLVTCVRNRALDVYRKQARERQTSGTVNVVRMGSATDNPAEKAVLAEEQQGLLKMVAQLPEHLRETLALRIWGESTFEEIAALQGTTKSTAHTRYRQALEELRSKLEKGE